ncbi:hypothetical protein [Flavobacterium sp.]|uniref:hypothetical protein n=1 Tax=Flavobacterium sp. TaxID=239 RepID=UPI003D6B3B98
MKATDKKEALQKKIIALQHQQAEELDLLKEQFQVTFESLKPLNYIKSTLQEITSSKDIRRDIFNGILLTAAGYLSKKVFKNSNNNLFSNILKSALNFVVNASAEKGKDSNQTDTV